MLILFTQTCPIFRRVEVKSLQINFKHRHSLDRKGKKFWSLHMFVYKHGIIEWCVREKMLSNVVNLIKFSTTLNSHWQTSVIQHRNFGLWTISQLEIFFPVYFFFCFYLQRFSPNNGIRKTINRIYTKTQPNLNDRREKKLGSENDHEIIYIDRHSISDDKGSLVNFTELSNFHF